MYIEVLYTIANTVGASTGQYAHYKEDLYRYAQEAFGVPPDQHRRYLNIASEEKVYRFIDFLLKKTLYCFLSRRLHCQSTIIGGTIIHYMYKIKLLFNVTATYRCIKRGSNRSRWT